MRHIFLFISGLLIYGTACAQDKGSYAGDFSQGNELLQKSKYAQALQFFLHAYNSDSSNANLAYKIGFCYIKLDGDKPLAVKYFEKAAAGTSGQYDAGNAAQATAPRSAYYYLGIAYHSAYKFGEAINSYKTFRQYVMTKDSLTMVDHRIEQSNNARMFVIAPTNAKIINIGDSVNSSYSDYNAVIAADESSIIFTSNRPLSGSNQSDESHPHIFISMQKNDTLWSLARLMDKSLNGALNNTGTFISADAQQLYITQSDGSNSSILTCFIDNGGWGAPKDPGGNINTPATSTNLCVSPDVGTLYFVSDRPDGYGGKDIWRCVKLPNGKWSLAVNLGSTINTPYNEETPFMHADGRTFFFSSEGHMGMGGYDIFFTQLLDNGKWVEPFNMGYPINTPDNETHFVLSGDSKHGYLSSDRPNGKGGDDIYRITMPHSGDKPLTVIKGEIALDNGNPLPDGVHIVATDNVTGQTIGDFKPVKTTGSYTIIVPPGKNYTLSYQNNDQEFYSEIIEVPTDAGYKEIRKALTLSSVTMKVTAVKDNKEPNK